MKMYMKITVTILTKNSERYLAAILRALKDFDEVLLLDSGSEDSTFKIAEQYSNVTVHRSEFLGFGEMHNKAAQLARNPWILSIDSDEVPTEALVREVRGLDLDRHCVYNLPRRNYYNGRYIKHCGWNPDRVKRLYHREQTRWTNAKVHESIITKGCSEVALDEGVLHYSYQGIGDFLQKMQVYSEYFAVENAGRKPSSPGKAALHGCYAFVKTYILQCGFLDGWEGFMIASYNANTAFYKYWKLYERNLSRQSR